MKESLCLNTLELRPRREFPAVGHTICMKVEFERCAEGGFQAVDVKWFRIYGLAIDVAPEKVSG
jgi:hypothetical protein